MVKYWLNKLTLPLPIRCPTPFLVADFHGASTLQMANMRFSISLRLMPFLIISKWPNFNIPPFSDCLKCRCKDYAIHYLITIKP